MSIPNTQPFSAALVAIKQQLERLPYSEDTFTLNVIADVCANVASAIQNLEVRVVVLENPPAQSDQQDNQQQSNNS